MSGNYELQVICKNPDCTVNKKRTTVGAALGPAPQSQEEAVRQLREIKWENGGYFRCQKCRRTYLYSASDIFIAEPRKVDVSGISGGKKEPGVPNEF